MALPLFAGLGEALLPLVDPGGAGIAAGIVLPFGGVLALALPLPLPLPLLLLLPLEFELAALVVAEAVPACPVDCVVVLADPGACATGCGGLDGCGGVDGVLGVSGAFVLASSRSANG